MTWQHLERDREFFARELDSFVPQRVFDAHAHLWQAAWWPDPPPHVQAAPATGGREAYAGHCSWVLPRREVRALFLPFPFAAPAGERLAVANAWAGAQLVREPRAPGLFLVHPTDDPDWVREQVRARGMVGLKPYHLYAPGESTWEAELPEYLPEPLVRVADKEGWVITLHLVRSRGIADPGNQYWLRQYCERYPRVRFVLAHCARGFNPYHVDEGLPALAGLKNLWLDTSAVCSPQAFLAALAVVGPERLLYGSDFPLSHLRLVNFPVADTFMWLDEDSALPPAPYHRSWELPLLGLESLRALKVACQTARLTERQVEAIFWDNATQLLDAAPGSGGRR